MQQRRTNSSQNDASNQPRPDIDTLRTRLAEKSPGVLEEKIPPGRIILGDITVKCRCHLCHSEDISATPVFWESLKGLSGECYKCEGYVSIETAFLNRQREIITVVTPECTADELLDKLQAVANYIPGLPPTYTPPVIIPPTLAKAITNGNAQEVEGLVNAENIDCVVVRGMTALFFACQQGKEDVVRCLLSLGADVNAKSKDSMRAMHAAAFGKNVEIVRLLCANGATVNDHDANGFSPLQNACQEGQLEICQFLVAHGADVRALTMTKATPLHLAARSGNRGIVALLIENQAQIEAKDVFGRTPLANAIYFGKEAAGKALLEAGASLVNIKKDLTIPTWAGGEPARLIALKDQRISELEAQMKALTPASNAPLPDPQADQRYRELDEARKVAQARCRQLERRIQEQEGQVTMLQDRGAHSRQLADKVEAENAVLVAEQPEHRKAEQLNQSLVQLQETLNQKVTALQRELIEVSEAYMRQASENMPIPWQTDEDHFNQYTPQFEQNKKVWREAQSELLAAEQKLSSGNNLTFPALIEGITARNQASRQLYRESCLFEEKSNARLSELSTFLAMVQPYRAQQSSINPPIKPITLEQLQQSVAELQQAADHVNINHKAMETCQRLERLMTEVRDLTVESTQEKLKQEKHMEKQEAALQLIHALEKLKRNYKRASMELTHARDRLSLESSVGDPSDLEAAQITLAQKTAGFVSTRDAYLQELRNIPDYINDFQELRSFVNEAPENPLLSLNDYQIVPDKTQKVWKANRNDLVYALKQRQKALVAREFHILKRIQHPFVMTAEDMISDSPSTAVLVMPWMEGGTLNQWLSTKRPTSTVRNVFYSVLQGLVHVHAAGIVHGDLRTQNILIDNNDQPRLCDFDQAIDPTYPCPDDATSTGSPRDDQALEYLAPELISQPPAPKSPTSDMFAFGLCMWNTFLSANKYYMRDNDAYPQVPVTTVPGLRMALEWLLRRDPKQRPSSQSALQLPFFTARSLPADSVLPPSQARLEAFRASIKLVRAFDEEYEDRPAIPITIRTHSMFRDIAEALWATHTILSVQFEVRFEGEEGIDGGALTTSMYVRFLNEAFKSPFFQQGPNGKCLPKAASVLTDEALLIYRAVGVAIARILIDERAVRTPCASSLFKFLQMDGAVCDLSDLEEFDTQLCRNMYTLLSKSGGCSLYGFEDVGEQPADVTSQNKQSFVDKYVQWQLMGSRMAPLLAIREGFHSLGEEINRHCRILTWQDLRLLLSGVEKTDPLQVVNRLIFEGFPAQSATPGFLRNVIMRFGPEELMRFLSFVTAQETLPAAAAPRPIKIIRVAGRDGRIPASHACFWQLDIPEYSSEEVLRERLLIAMETEAKFTMH